MPLFGHDMALEFLKNHGVVGLLGAKILTCTGPLVEVTNLIFTKKIVHVVTLQKNKKTFN